MKFTEFIKDYVKKHPGVKYKDAIKDKKVRCLWHDHRGKEIGCPPCRRGPVQLATLPMPEAFEQPIRRQYAPGPNQAPGGPPPPRPPPAGGPPAPPAGGRRYDNQVPRFFMRQNLGAFSGRQARQAQQQPMDADGQPDQQVRPQDVPLPDSDSEEEAEIAPQDVPLPPESDDDEEVPNAPLEVDTDSEEEQEEIPDVMDMDTESEDEEPVMPAPAPKRKADFEALTPNQRIKYNPRGTKRQMELPEERNTRVRERLDGLYGQQYASTTELPAQPSDIPEARTEPENYQDRAAEFAEEIAQEDPDYVNIYPEEQEMEVDESPNVSVDEGRQMFDKGFKDFFEAGKRDMAAIQSNRAALMDARRPAHFNDMVNTLINRNIDQLGSIMNKSAYVKGLNKNSGGLYRVRRYGDKYVYEGAGIKGGMPKGVPKAGMREDKKRTRESENFPGYKTEEEVANARNRILGMRRVDYLANISDWRPAGTKRDIRGMELHRFYHSDHRNARPPQTNPPEELKGILPVNKEDYKDSRKFFAKLGLKEAWDAYHNDKYSTIYEDNGLINQIRDGRGKKDIYDEEVWMKGRPKAPKAPKPPKTAEQLEARRTEAPYNQQIRLEKRMREMMTQEERERLLREKRDRAEANKRDRELRGLTYVADVEGPSAPSFAYGSHPQFGKQRAMPSQAPMVEQMAAALERQLEEKRREEEARRERHYARERIPMTQGFRELYDEENFWERTGGSDFWVPSRPSGYENLSFEEKYGED